MVSRTMFVFGAVTPVVIRDLIEERVTGFALSLLGLTDRPGITFTHRIAPKQVRPAGFVFRVEWIWSRNTGKSTASYRASVCNCGITSDFQTCFCVPRGTNERFCTKIPSGVEGIPHRLFTPRTVRANVMVAEAGDIRIPPRAVLVDQRGFCEFNEGLLEFEVCECEVVRAEILGFLHAFVVIADSPSELRDIILALGIERASSPAFRPAFPI